MAILLLLLAVLVVAFGILVLAVLVAPDDEAPAGTPRTLRRRVAQGRDYLRGGASSLRSGWREEFVGDAEANTTVSELLDGPQPAEPAYLDPHEITELLRGHGPGSATR